MSRRSARDREVINLTAGEPLLSDSSVDLSVSVTSTGFGTTPVQLRLTENGRPIETRQVSPTADGSPMHELFTVSPSPDRATVYGVEIPVEARELVAENNTRRVLVPPQGRRRRVLVVEGAPGFEHTFLKRALAHDQSLDVDSVVRKGRNDQGRDTFFIQAGGGRSALLGAGYPIERAALFGYDAILFGNIEGDFFSRDQLEMTASFVAAQGRRAARARREVVRARRPGRHAARRGAATGSDRSARRRRAHRLRGGAAVQRARPHRRRNDASGHADRGGRRRQPEALEPAAAARVGGGHRHAASRRPGAGGDQLPAAACSRSSRPSATVSAGR